MDSLLINGVPYCSGTLGKLDDSTVPWQRDLQAFLSNWFSDRDVIIVQTSGSTGKPKSIAVSRQAMIESARRTIDFFNLKPEQSVLLCLPVTFIAGIMMVVRALVGNLNLIVVEPSGFPLQNINQHIDFAAFTPMQMMNELSAKDGSKLNLLKKVIIGGGAVNSQLSALLMHQTFEAFETYGMTETLTHVALRRINGDQSQETFHPLPGVNVTIDQRGCLVLNVPHISNGEIITNDLAELQSDGSFYITGRVDNVINSGGIKIQPEKVEAVLSSIIQDEFYATSVQHPSLGEQMVLVVNNVLVSPEKTFTKIGNALPRFLQPASLFYVDVFPKTKSGKINRMALKNLLIGLEPFYSRTKKNNP